MNGRDMGTLEVFAGERNSKQKVWSISGNQNDKWSPVGVDILPANDLVVSYSCLNKLRFIRKDERKGQIIENHYIKPQGG